MAASAVQEQQRVVLEPPGFIVLARPLHELGHHLYNGQLPSWELIARVIKTLTLAIFRWHLCDEVYLVAADLQTNYHSMRGRTEEMRNQAMARLRPYGGETSLVLVPIQDLPNENWPIPTDQQMIRIDCENYTLERLDLVTAYPGEISAQTIQHYFLNMYGVDLTHKEGGNTITDLVYSRELRVATPDDFD